MDSSEKVLKVAEAKAKDAGRGIARVDPAVMDVLGLTAGDVVQIEVVGSRGRLQIGNPYKPGIGEQISFTRRDKTEVIQIPGQELYIGEVEDMADVILEGKPPRISLEDSRGNLAAILALIQSAGTGKVECPEV